ncbi:hypothetical protein ABZX85_17440 [Streptomyces sp. NPDC004539]|uniref:hypothetical protein n=1 Tax=Streptomyces sp. NPDC004539 TaxID=3154280 RepID=UPI0033A1C3D5
MDPAKFRCGTLAAQLADEWLIYTRSMKRSDGGADLAQAVRAFATYADEHLPTVGLDPAEARLERHGAELVEAIHGWEQELRDRHGLRSNRPYVKVNSLLTLLEQRVQRGDSVAEALRLRALAPAAYPGYTSEPLDEYSNAERIVLRDAARAAVRALEARLVRGSELLARGVDPRADGDWHEPANLVGAAHSRLLTTGLLKPRLPESAEKWPSEVKALLPAAEDGTLLKRGLRYLIPAVGALLFPAETDLQAFRILLLLGMSDTTPEELHDLHLPDLEFTDGGVRLVQRKDRAERIRADLHADPEEDQAAGAVDFLGDGAWDVPGLLRRLLAVTALTREVFPEAEPWLFLAVERRWSGVLDAGVATFLPSGRRFSDWIGDPPGGTGGPLAVSAPYDVRRLRKTTKTVRAVALGGTVSDLAGDDHHVEVYRNHYAHGTTAHVLAGRAINKAQRWVFERLSERPVLVTSEAEARLEEPEVAADLGLSVEEAKLLRAGELDMGLVNCRNPHSSPHRRDNKVCHVAPAMCMLCRNAVVFTSHLPRLLLLSDHIETMRARLAPPRWQALWGRQAAALAEVFEECAELVPAARREIVELGVRLDLPLGLRTEYDR